MAGSATKGTRKVERQTSHHDLTAFLKKAESGESIRCILVGTSVNDIRIRSLDFLKVNSEVKLMINDETLYLRVTASTPDVSKDSVWHIRLLAIDPACEVKIWLDQHGLDTSVLCGSGHNHEKFHCENTIDFQVLRQSIATANTYDSSFSRKPGMEKRRAFPINVNGISLIAILPKDFKPYEISHLDEKDAETLIMVLKRASDGPGNDGWALVWPLPRVLN